MLPGYLRLIFLYQSKFLKRDPHDQCFNEFQRAEMLPFLNEGG